ncbi:hypothetical protein [Dyella sp. 2RAB6]|uniref:hypothetical protein n=1 Tax=Dyella sp. 2RAB6 TaxID=3232992 RepID=UPI003F8FD49E
MSFRTPDGLVLKHGLDHRQDAERITTRHSFVGKKGDLLVELHFGDFNTGHGRQAALKIFSRRLQDNAVYIPLSELWKFTEADALHVLVPILAKQIYGFVTKDDQYRVLDAIVDYLGDLRKSPPDPSLSDRSLDRFLESCADEGVDFFVDVNGKRVVG